MVPIGDERFDQFALGGRMCFGYSQGYFMLKILTWIQIWRLGGLIQHLDIFLSLDGDQSVKSMLGLSKVAK